VEKTGHKTLWSLVYTCHTWDHWRWAAHNKTL